VQWTFQLPVALSMQRQTTASLVALQQTIAQGGNGLLLSFSVQGLQNSGQQPQSCDLAGLIASAQVQSATVTFGLGYSGNPGPHTVSITVTNGDYAPGSDSDFDFCDFRHHFRPRRYQQHNHASRSLGRELLQHNTAYTYDSKGNASPFLQ
jgi:hypothetical protein